MTNEEWVLVYKMGNRRQKNDAIKAILSKNQGIIKAHTMRVRNWITEEKDFIQFITPTIINAIYKYDQKRGFRFMSFLTWEIKGAVSKFNKKVPLIKPQLNKKTKMNDYWIESSLNEPDYNEIEPITLLEALSEEKNPDAIVFANAILSRLSERDKYVLKAYFGIDNGEPKNLSQVGEAMGCTREFIRQIKDRTLKRLKKRIQMESIWNPVFKELLESR